ncbi:putative Serine/threonine-protein kinase SAPK10 [Hibiscus syriacus]|uniref:Serine/threonine-protein kinase SAPK10 n=1 Tax=Hibiscus syriacus TaxID=106335 RepID=A0A6A3AYM1_HIBSY|nr:transcription factor HHO5-like [Hibiscus syriacus]KAE8709546.1 putative Serine/threonine-protein kinase SAPK10 [Hibiscus syriacus]
MDLSLDLSFVYVPSSISEFLKEVSKIKNGFQRLLKISDFVKRLEDEMKKIDAFKRELPLCMLLLKDGIERLKEEEMQCKEMDDGSVTKGLMLPLKGNTEENGSVNVEKKKSWMSSVQLWNSDSDNVDHSKKSNEVPELKLRSEEEEENPIELCNDEIVEGQENFGLSLMFPSSELGSRKPISKDNGSRGIGLCPSMYSDQNQLEIQTEHQQQHELLQRMHNSKKQRRCWSPELHRRFVEALQQLGGSKVATPKQIRELMQVDGLTNDEVKSHLQKYRLHSRKLPASSAGQGNMGESAQNQCNKKTMKANVSQSASPQGPLFAGERAKGLSSTTGGNSMVTEEDEKSDGRI